MNYKKLDYFLLPFTFLCFLVSTYFLVADQIILNLTQINSIGTITSKSNTVKTKRGDSLFWSNAHSGEKLDQSDKIYTHENSEAKIKIENGPNLNISENTLLSLSQFLKNKEITVSKGFIVAELSNEKEEFKVKLGEKIITLNSKSAKVRISTSKNNSSVSILDGQVEIKENKNITKAKKGQVITKVKNKKLQVSDITANLISPKINEDVFLKESSPTVSFKWVSEESGILQISKDYSFKKILISKKTIDFRDSVKLNPGRYFWRIKVKEKESIVQSFTAIPERTTILTSPSANTTFSYQGRNPQIFFNWNDSFFTDFEISINDNIQVIKNRDYITTNSLPEGIYKWKVRPLNSDKSLWSKEAIFTIKSPPLPESPILIAPLNNHEVILFPNSRAVFRWSASNQKKYLFQISTDSSFDNIVFQEETITNKLEMNIKKSGKFYWRVKSIDNLQRETNFSIPNAVSINLYETNMIPASGAKLVINKPSKKVEFKWKDLRTKENKRVAYTFELSSNDSFSTIEKSELVKTNYIETSIPKIGTYYWRTKVVIEGKPPYYGDPQRVTISPTPPPSKPKIQDKLEIELKINYIIDGIKRIFSNFMNFLIPTVSAAEVNTSAKIKWDQIADTKKYYLEIYLDDDLKEKVLEVELSENEYTLKNFKEGTYYWRIATLDFWNRRSEFSNLSILSLKLPEVVKKISKVSLNFPKKNFSFVGKKKFIQFKWKKSPEAIKYQIYLSKKSDFSSTYLMRTITKNQYSISISAGKYFWKVVAFNKYDRSIESDSNYFTIDPIKEKRNTTLHTKSIPEYKNKSFLYFQYDIALSEMSQTYSNYSISAKDPIFTSLELGAHHLLSKATLNFKVRRFSGKVFNEESYGVLALETSYEYSITKNLVTTLGLSLNSFKSYNRENSTIKSKSNSSLSIPISLGYNSLFKENRNRLTLSYSIGSLSRILIQNTFDFNFKEKNFFSIGTGFESYSASLDQSDFKISNILGSLRYNISY